MKVTIFIPFFNGDKFLDDTIKSIISQTYNDWELLAIDDSSTDETLVKLNEYASLNPRIRVFTKPNQGNVPYSWNFIKELISGEWILYMSQDDLLDEECLSLLVKTIRNNSCDVAVPKTYMYAYGKIDDDFGYPKNFENSCIDSYEAFVLSLNYTIPGHCLWNVKMVQTTLPMRTDAFDMDDYMQRIWFLKSKKIGFSNAVYYYRQDNPDAITKKFSFIRFSSLLTVVELYKLIEINVKNKKIEKAYCEKYIKYVLYLNAMFLIYEKDYNKEQINTVQDLINDALIYFFNNRTKSLSFRVILMFVYKCELYAKMCFLRMKIK